MTTRVFFMAEQLPFPPRGGPDFRTWMIAQAATGFGPVGVFGVSHRRTEPSPLVDIDSWSTASRESALAHDGDGLGDGTWVKDPAWRPSAWYYHDAVDRELETALTRFGPDVVVIEQLGLAQYIPTARRHAETVVLNNHNIETDLQRQLAEVESSPVEKMVRQQFAYRTELLERETLAKVDQVWVCSNADRTLLEESFGAASDVIPNAVAVDEYHDAYASRPDRAMTGPSLVFPAQFGYLPNENGAVLLLEEILPATLAVLPDATLVLPGREPGPRIMEAAAGLPATITGPVRSMKPFLRSADVMVIPLREGSGTRLKALEAFAAGLPVVSTAKGVEGLGATPGTHYLEADTAAEFASAIRHVSEGGVASEMRAAAHEFVQSNHSPAAVERAVAAALQETSRSVQ